VCAEIEDAVILLENMLGTVAMVGVKIDDKYAPIAAEPGISGGHGDIVENTETHTLICFGMVSGGANCTERPVDLSLSALLHCLYDRACRVERSIKRTLRQKRIGIELSGTKVSNLFNIILGVDTDDVIESRPPRTESNQSGPEARCFKRDDDIDEAVGRIGMPDRRLMAQKDFIVSKTDFFHKEYDKLPQ